MAKLRTEPLARKRPTADQGLDCGRGHRRGKINGFNARYPRRFFWRGEINGIRPDVRERLGWATEPEFAFDSAHQCMTLSLMRYWVCFQRGPRGEILRLHPDSTAQVRLVWEEW